LILAIFYTCAVTVVDSFLGTIPIVNWLALGIVFVIFTAMILDSAAKLLAANGRIARNTQEKPEDELDRLERLVERALGQGQAEPMMLLEKRVRLLKASAQAKHIERRMLQSDEFVSQSTYSTAQEEIAPQRSADYSRTPNELRAEIEGWLSQIEDWLS
jgi:ABC-type transport system involved in multi-copper enzyme maturation permease subunit